MGEHQQRPIRAPATLFDSPDSAHIVEPLVGRMHMRWDERASATPHGQLVYFAEFLATTGVFDRWVSSGPLGHHSGNAPHKRDVLGTLMLVVLGGHRRYAHICALRGDAVAAQQHPPQRRAGAVA